MGENSKFLGTNWVLTLGFLTLRNCPVDFYLWTTLIGFLPGKRRLLKFGKGPTWPSKSKTGAAWGLISWGSFSTFSSKFLIGAPRCPKFNFPVKNTFLIKFPGIGSFPKGRQIPEGRLPFFYSPIGLGLLGFNLNGVLTKFKPSNLKEPFKFPGETFLFW